MSALKRNFTFERNGWTFHYLARTGRLQVYLPGRNRAGVLDVFYEHIDEMPCRVSAQEEAKQLASAWIESNDETGGGSAAAYREQMARWRPDLVL